MEIVAKTNLRTKSGSITKLHKEINVAVGALLFAGARSENPKLLGFVLLRDSVYLVTLRAYLVQHAHTFLPLSEQNAVNYSKTAALKSSAVAEQRGGDLRER